jgi:hypothetical protein
MSVLRNLFGPSKAEIWQQFCDRTGGTYIRDSFWKNGKAQAAHGQWIVTLDTIVIGKVTYTRMRAPYVNPDGFTFTVYRKSVFTDLGKWLGMQDVMVGYPEFDEPFVIKGNDEHKLQRLFANRKIRDLISAQPEVRFSVVDDEKQFWGCRGFPKDVDELHFLIAGVIKDVDRLKLLYDLFSETLDELCRIGSAYENAPDVKL